MWSNNFRGPVRSCRQEETTRRRNHFPRIITGLFLIGFIFSTISTFSAFAATNLFKIQNAELSELSATAEGSILSFDETNIISNVTFHKLNDSATYTITLKNADDKSHVIENITDDNENPYVVYDYDTHAGEQINAGSDLIFVVTARYANAVADVNERAQATNVKFLIEFTDIEEEVPLVPDTGANTAAGGYLRFSVISLVISAVGLTIIGLVAIKKHQKAGRFIIVGLIAIAAVTTTAIAKAATIEINSFTIKTNFSLKDRLVVTWTDANGNEHEEVVSYDEPANIEDQEKEGYTFTGWVDEDGNPVDPTQPITEDMKIHPTFRANKYTIKFHGNGATGGEMTDLTMTFDEAKALTTNTFTWAGHEYTGWDTTANGSGTHYDDQAEVKNLATSDNAVIDLYAQWSVNPFRINYDSNGATSGEMATTNCEYDQTCTLRENAFKKTGYDFKGWTYDGADYADKADVTNIIENGTITMSAKWEAHVYSIEYTGLTTEEATYLRAQGNPDTYTIETSSFTLIKPADRLDADGDTREHCVGWRDISVYEDITLPIADALGDKKYEAVWQTVALPEYSITYDYNGGTVATENPTKLNKEQSATLSEPTKTGYTFTGWTGTTISGDAPVKPYTIPAPHQKGNLEYTAHYRAHAYTVNFDINTDDTSVSGAMQPLAFSYDEEKALTANAFTRTGYTFAGWKFGDAEYTDGQTVKNLTAEDGAIITLKAQWEPINYTIDFNGNGATEGSMSYIPTEYDEEITLPTSSFTRTGYTQNGWKNGAESVADQATVKNLAAEDGATVTLDANWEPIHYNVIFDINTDDTHVSGTMQPLAFSYDEEKPLTANAFTRTGYTFAGWKLGDAEYTDGQTVENLTAEDGATVTLKAQWTPNTFTIIFHHTNNEVSNQDAMTPQAVTYDVATTIKPNTYEREHYKFMGWATNATQAANADTRAKVNTAKVYDDEANITNAVTENNGELHLYAIWLERTSELNKGYEIWWGNFREALGNNDIVSFEEYTGDQDVSTIESRHNIALPSSNFPTYLWMETDEQGAKRAYWWSEAEHPKMNSDIRQMFDALPQIERIDLSGFIFPNATVMSGVFRGDTKLTTVIFPSEAPTIAAGTSMANMFNGCASLENLNMIKNWNFSGVTDMSGLFQGARSLNSLESIKDWSVSNVATMYRMFYGSGIESVEPIKDWNVDNVENMREMFAGANKLTSIDLSGWHTSGKLKDIAAIFESGVATEPTLTINLSGWDTSNVSSAERAFANGRLTELDVSGWDMSSLVSGPFMFGIYANNIETIYYDGGSLPFDSEADTHGIFRGDAKLVGGAGSTSLDKELNVYARVDDPCSGKPGYFTWKDHQYICFHANYEGSTATAGQYVSTTAPDQLESNPFIRPGYVLVGWAETADGEKVYDNNGAITLTESVKSPKQLYAVWYKLEATLDTGANVNTILKNLATEPTAFVHYAAGTPNFDAIDDEQDIALPSSDVPVYVWYDTESTKIYWWSEAVRPKMNTDSSSFFAGMSSVTSIDVEGLDASNATNMSHMFRGTGLTDIDFSKLESQNVTDMSYMFYGIKKTNTLDVSKLDTSSVRNMASMFEGASFTSISFFDTLNPSASKFKTNEVTSMHYMFKDSTKLTSLDLSSFNTSNVRDFSGTFYGATGLKTLNLDGWDTGNATTMYIMFNNAPSLTRLDLSHFDTKNVTTMQQMFEGCFNLEYLNVSGWSNEKVGNMSYMFHKVGNYKNGVEIILTGFKTPAVTTMAYMFTRDVTELETLDLSSFDTSNVTSMSSMFGGGSQGNGTFYNAKIKTVYASDKFVTTKVDPESNVFNNTSVIVGGAGTTWSQKTAAFARVDDPDNGNPGYFTLKGARYIRYNGNGADNATPYGAMTSEYLKAGDSLKKNAFTRRGFRFTGWKDADDNEYTDEQVMAEFVESKTPLELYAQWEPMDVTITFRSNFDGVNDTMAQQTITVGEQNNLDANQYSVDHYRFLGWTTEPQGKVMGNESTAIDYADQASTAGFVGDTDLYAKWLYRCRTFATDSWNTIVTNLESDSTYYDATDVCEKEIQMDLDDDSVKETYGLRLINTSTPEECSTPGFSQTACGTVIEFTNYVGIWQWNSVNSTNGGWANATLATRLNGEDLYGKMPEELRSVIIPTYPIVSGANQNGVSPDITASDTNKNKIYLHTGKELGVPKSAFDDKEDLTRTYDFYGVSEHKPYLNRAGGGQWSYDWWLRSALLSRDNIPLGIKSDVRSMISTTPGANGNVATYPAFRIGRKLTVSFNAGEGAASETTREYAVSAMNYDTLPTVTTAPEGKIFAGWYTAAEGGDRVNDNDTFVSSNAHTLYAHWITPTFYNITEMQQMTADICATATTPNTNASQFDTTGENVGDKSYIPRRELIDNRDGKSYQVTKLADGKCWMTENLAIGDPDSTMTLASADSDVTSSLTLPQSNIAVFTGSADIDAVYVDDTFGGYYSSKVARANYANEGDSSICPKGWRLPNATTSAPRDWEILQSTYDISSVNTLYGEPFNFTRSFYVSNGAIRRNNGWLDTYYVGPGTTSNSYNNFGVTISDNWTGTSRITGAEGGSVRCVAR